MNKLLLSIIICTFLFSAFLYTEKARAENKPKVKKEQPIQIVSDRMDANNEKRMVVFSGNAVATRGDMIIKAERIFLYYKGGVADSEGPGSREIGKRRDLEKVEAKGHVTVTQGEKIVTGDEAVFYQDTRKILITGNTVLQEGRNIIQGGRVVIFLDENRGIVESSENKRVTAIIYPEEADKEEKK
jgi:lipopolysaccharide export system protein LptA